MSTPLAALLFLAGLGLVIYCSEKLVEGTVGTAASFGLSAFLISVVFIGFDPENLFVGAAGSVEGTAGIALGSVIGAAMVAVALAFGITVLIVPLRFERAPRSILAVSPLAVLLFGALALDGHLARLDGALLLLGYGAAVTFLARRQQRGADVTPVESVEGMLSGDLQDTSRWKALGLFVPSLAGIVAGSELLVRSSKTFIERLDLSDTTFGMTILALVVSIEEVARELPAALKGRPDVSFGNVVGSVLAFFLFNAGLIALVHPVEVGTQTLSFYLPVALGTVVVVSLFMLRKELPRWAGVMLVLAYVLFALGGYVPGLSGG